MSMLKPKAKRDGPENGVAADPGTAPGPRIVARRPLCVRSELDDDDAFLRMLTNERNKLHLGRMFRSLVTRVARARRESKTNRHSPTIAEIRRRRIRDG
ncbi:MAG: hypothetical protein V3R88_12355 [Alphaproteobacteria bacterium]